MQTPAELRAEAKQKFAEATSHYKHAQTCPSIEYAAWIAIAAECEARGYDLQRLADLRERGF